MRVFLLDQPAFLSYRDPGSQNLKTGSRQEESELPDGPSPRNHNPRHPQRAASSKGQQIAFSHRPNSGPLLA